MNSIIPIIFSSTPFYYFVCSLVSVRYIFDLHYLRRSLRPVKVRIRE